MLAKPTPELPVGDGWRYEPKWDGFRALVFRDGPDLYLQSRDLKPLDRYFPELLQPLLKVGGPTARFVLDGEIVIATNDGLDFEALLLRDPSRGLARRRCWPARRPAAFVAFDCLAEGADDLRDAPLDERRARLERLLADPPASVLLTPATADPAMARHWFEVFEGAGLDGVIAKRSDLRYLPGKREMAKIKHLRTADCVVAGFRWHKNGPGNDGRLAAAGALERRRSAPARWRHRVVHRGQASGVGRIPCPLPRERARGAPLARVEGVGGRRGREAAAGRNLALEPRQGPLVGAAAPGARLRGRLRPPPGRPIPPRHDVPALAPRPHRRRAAATTSWRRRRLPSWPICSAADERGTLHAASPPSKETPTRDRSE